jgi:DNA repair exonuclease SbcCD nuclease subunit
MKTNSLVLWSDLHLHAFQPFSKIDPSTGLNSRLLDGISVLKQIRQYCEKNKITTVLNGGDLLHKGAQAPADLLELLIRELIEFKQTGVEIISVVGQHDFMRRDGAYSLPKALSPLMTVLNDPGESVEIGDDVRIIGCSFREGVWNQKEALRKCGESIDPGSINILLGHFMVQEILQKNAAPFDVSGYVSLDDIPKGIAHAFLGDYHFHIKQGNVVSIGAAQQHTFGSKNRPQAGFLDLDLKSFRFKRIEVKAPMFIEIKPTDDFPGSYSPDNFYNVYVEDEKQQDRIKAKLTDDWQVAFPRVATEEDQQLEGIENVGIDVSMDPSEVLNRFVKHFGLSPEYLEKGLSYLGG